MQKLETKKPAVDLTDLAIGIVVLGIITSIGASILITTRDARLTSLDTVTTTNESLSFTGNSAYLAKEWGASIIKIINQTTGATVTASGNYTYSINSATGQITITNLTSTWQPWYIHYTWYNTSRPDWDLPNKSSLGLMEYGSWFKILVVVGVASLILGIIILSFGRRSSGSEIGGTY